MEAAGELCWRHFLASITLWARAFACCAPLGPSAAWKPARQLRRGAHRAGNAVAATRRNIREQCARRGAVPRARVVLRHLQAGPARRARWRGSKIESLYGREEPPGLEEQWKEAARKTKKAAATVSEKTNGTTGARCAGQRTVARARTHTRSEKGEREPSATSTSTID